MALMPLKPHKVGTAKKKRTNAVLANAANLGPLNGPQTRPEISAKSIAEDKGFHLPSIKDIAKASLPVVEAVTDTLAIPQRAGVAIATGKNLDQALLHPYAAKADKLDPSDALKLSGVKGFAADAVLDPLNLVPGAGLAKVAIKEGAKGTNFGLRAAKASIDNIDQVATRSTKKEIEKSIAAERKTLSEANAKADETIALDKQAGTQARVDEQTAALRNKQSGVRKQQQQNYNRLNQIKRNKNNTSAGNLLYGGRASELRPSKGFKSIEEEANHLRKHNNALAQEHASLESSIRDLGKARVKVKRMDDQFYNDVADAHKTKNKVAKRTEQLDKQEEALKTAPAQEELAKQDYVGQMVDQTIAPKAQGSMLYLRPQFTNMRIPLATIRSEKMAKALEKAGKIPGFTKVSTALGKSFNTNFNSDRLLIEAGRGALGTGAADAQRIVNPIARKVDNMSKKDYNSTNEIFRSLYDKKELDGANPESWAAAHQTWAGEASKARQLAENASSEASRASHLRKAAYAEDIANRAKTAADNWAKINDNSKDVYRAIREHYDNERAVKLASGEIKGTRHNYVPSFETGKDGRDMLPYAKEPSKIKTTDQSQLAKLREGLPDNFDFFDSFRAAVSGSSHARASSVLARSVAKRFGKDFDPGEGWVEFVQGRGATKERLWIPKEIDQSLTNLVKLGTSGRSQNELIKGFQKGISKWKILAYSINPGHFLVDTIGDLWNVSLRLGLSVVNPDRMSRVLPAQRSVEKYFQAMEKGEFSVARKIAATKVTLGGHEYSIRELATGIEFASIRDTGYSVADIGDYNPRAAAQLKKGHPLRAIGSGMQVLGNKRDNLGKRLAYLLAVDVRGKSFNAKGSALIEAGRDVRICLFDYSELTPFEKSVARNAIPFYTWTRKNVPFQLRSLAERPAMTVAPFKLQENLQKQEKNPNYLIPDYMRERYLRIGKLPGPVADLLGQDKNQPFYINPLLPSFDLGFLQGGRGGIDLNQGLGMLNPAIKAPFELATGKQIGTGAPVDGTVFSNANDTGIPFLGRKGEYAIKSFLGQPGSVAVNSANDKRLESNRILPGVGMMTGIRGGTVDTAKEQRRLDAQLRDAQDAYIQYLQDTGQVPSYDRIKALKQRPKAPELISPYSRRRLKFKPFGQ